MNYRDVIREMEASGHYGEAEELRRSMDQHSIFEYDHVYSRSDARDGLSIMSYAGDKAEEAYEDIKSAQRREEQRIEDERERQEEYERRRHQWEQEQAEMEEQL